MTAQMTDKEIIEGLKLEHDILSRTSHSDPRGPSDLQKERMELYKAAISRLQSIQWIPIEEIPEEWKDGRGLIGFCEMNECQLECWYDGSPEMKGWVSTHAWGDEIDISFVKPIYDPPTAFNQEEE